MVTQQSANTGMSEDTKTLITVLLLIFVFPVGLIMMWVWTKWKMWVKLLITIPLLLIFLATLMLFTVGFMAAFNPGAQFKKAHDTQRRSDLCRITNAVYQYVEEHEDMLPDTDGNDNTSNFPTVPTCIGTSPSCFNLGIASNENRDELMVPMYIADMPTDPKNGNDADTGYMIYLDKRGQYDRITAVAKGEIEEEIVVAR